MSTELVVARPEDRVDQAEVEMNLCRIRHLPVLDAEDRLVGILSHRDVLAAVRSGRRDCFIAQLMVRRIMTVNPDTPAHEAASAMLARKIGSLPVVEGDDKLVGLITESDLLLVARDALLGREPKMLVDGHDSAEAVP